MNVRNTFLNLCMMHDVLKAKLVDLPHHPCRTSSKNDDSLPLSTSYTHRCRQRLLHVVVNHVQPRCLLHLLHRSSTQTPCIL